MYSWPPNVKSIWYLTLKTKSILRITINNTVEAGIKTHSIFFPLWRPHYVVQAGLEPTAICLPQSPESLNFWRKKKLVLILRLVRLYSCRSAVCVLVNNNNFSIFKTKINKIKNSLIQWSVFCIHQKFSAISLCYLILLVFVLLEIIILTKISV